jgi:hypothetical protein
MTHEQLQAEKNKDWAFSILSDAQELIHMGMYAEANEKINDAKRALLGKYIELENGFMIQIIKPNKFVTHEENVKGGNTKL